MEEMSLIDKLVALVDDFDIALLLPKLDTVMGRIETFARLCVIIVPLVMLGLGLWYLLLPPKEANFAVGFRCYFGMGSVEAWRFTQRIAGLTWTALGGLLFIIMLLISTGFGRKEAMEMVGAAVSCVIWELVLIGLSSIAIHVLVGLRYDKDGYPRK